MARRPDLDDGKGDTAGHSGEQRAVLPYQHESYDYWVGALGRDDLRLGEFGENVIVEGLPEAEACNGGRYRILETESGVATADELVGTGAARRAAHCAGRPTDWECRSTQRPTASVRPSLWPRSTRPRWVRSPKRPHPLRDVCPLAAITPGVTGARRVPHHLPRGPVAIGSWSPSAAAGSPRPSIWARASLPEMAEACDVPARWSCRAGVCHGRRTLVLAGQTAEPLEQPAEGEVLVYCAWSADDPVRDM